jgi:hypothetical protein
VGDATHTAFGKKFTGGKRSVRQCRDATASSFVANIQGEFSHSHRKISK